MGGPERRGLSDNPQARGLARHAPIVGGPDSVERVTDHPPSRPDPPPPVRNLRSRGLLTVYMGCNPCRPTATWVYVGIRQGGSGSVER